MSVQVAVIRPGATAYDEQQRLQGNLELPLSIRGEQEARVLAERLESTGLAALYCGPVENARRTAEIIGDVLGLRPRCLDELANLDQGLWQGLQIEEIRRRNLKVFRQWIEDPLTVCPPQGETVADALARAKAALRPLWRRHRNQLLGVVVGEPLAQLVAAYLRGEPKPHLDEVIRTGFYERIELPPHIERNGWTPPKSIEGA